MRLILGGFMKKIFFIISACALICNISTVSAAVASDYYTPLKVGNYVILHSVTGLDPTGWARTTEFILEGSDMIAGKQYIRERGVEIADAGQAWTSDTFRIFWLRKDSLGNVVLGAMANNGSSNINSATLINSSMFPNDFLTKGYSRKYAFGNQTYQDSVVSTTETVTTSAGTFNNCIHIKYTHFDSLGAAVFCEDQCYAYKIGMVQNYRSLPISQLHTDQLTSYYANAIKYYNHYQQNVSLLRMHQNSLKSFVKLSFSVASSSFVSLNVFDLSGRNIATLASEQLSAGNYSRQLNVNGLANGVYYCRLYVGSLTDVQKIVIHK